MYRAPTNSVFNSANLAIFSARSGLSTEEGMEGWVMGFRTEDNAVSGKEGSELVLLGDDAHGSIPNNAKARDQVI